MGPDPSTSTPTVIDELVVAYQRMQPAYARFAERLAGLIALLLDEAEIKVHVVEQRAKEIESLRAKIAKPEKVYRDLGDVTDLAGVRIIVYSPDDVARVTDVLWREFEIDGSNSHDTAQRLKPNEFGYRSEHFVISLDSVRAVLPEWRSFAGLCAEFQVRTVLQHAWAAISHALNYKTEAEIPNELARKLFRISGLLELADDEFSEIRTRGAILASKAAAAVAAGDLKVPLSRSALAAYIHQSDMAAQLRRLGSEAGFRLTEESEEPWEDGLGDIAKICAYVHIRTLAELDEVCRRGLPKAAGFFTELVSTSKTRWGADTPFFIVLMVILDRPSFFFAVNLVQLGWDFDIGARVHDIAAKHNTGLTSR